MSIQVLKKLSEKEKQELKKGVIEVEGKAMNRTALGVVAAVFKLFPNITYKELKEEILPDKINWSAPRTFKHGYIPYTDLPYGVVQKKELVEKLHKEYGNETHFMEPENIFKTSDGVEVCVSKLWESTDTITGETDIQNLINHVSQFGIRVVSFQSTKPFKRGSYQLEIINPVILQKIQNLQSPQKSYKNLIIAGAAALVLLLLIFFLTQNVNKPETKEPPKVEQTEKQTITTIEKVKDKISKGESVKDLSINFHNILFEYDSDKIRPESENDLQEAYNFLKDYPQLKVKIIGHTSLEGDANYNLHLSERRAKAVYNYLINKGIAKDRLSFEGKGLTEPLVNDLSEEAHKKNRRTEFKILGE